MTAARTLLLSGLLVLSAAERADAAVSGPLDACSNNSCPSIVSAVPARAPDLRGKRLQSPAPTQPGSILAGGSLTLRGRLAGNWDQVDGNVVFTYDFTAVAPDIGPLQVLVRGLPAVQTSPDEYSVEWDRSAYWLDFDGNAGGVPHLLGTLQLESQYVPLTSNDPYPEFANDPAVIATCTASTPCTVQLSEYTLLREPGVDYSAYPDLAAPADLLFVASPLGQAIAAAVDVFDANGQFVETKDLVTGDQLKISIIGYKLGEPDSVYLVEHMDFVALQAGLRIELQNYIPGVDFVDPSLPPNLNAGDRRMKLLLDANRDTEGTITWAFGGPFDLGFTWRDALTFLFRSGFDDAQPAANAAPVLVKQRR